MLRQATVEDIRSSRVTRRHGRIVVVTRFYPRYLQKKLVDEYASDLAPAKELLVEFKDREKAIEDHDRAFDEISYESKFTLRSDGLDHLRSLCELARDRDVYFVCHCKIGSRCHREILMLIGSELFGAKVGRLHFDWDGIRRRLPQKIVAR